MLFLDRPKSPLSINEDPLTGAQVIANHLKTKQKT